MRISCPNCRAGVTDKYEPSSPSGGRVTCPRCGRDFTAPRSIIAPKPGRFDQPLQKAPNYSDTDLDEALKKGQLTENMRQAVIDLIHQQPNPAEARWETIKAYRAFYQLAKSNPPIRERVAGMKALMGRLGRLGRAGLNPLIVGITSQSNTIYEAVLKWPKPPWYLKYVTYIWTGIYLGVWRLLYSLTDTLLINDFGSLAVCILPPFKCLPPIAYDSYVVVLQAFGLWVYFPVLVLARWYRLRIYREWTEDRFYKATIYIGRDIVNSLHWHTIIITVALAFLMATAILTSQNYALVIMDISLIKKSIPVFQPMAFYFISAALVEARARIKLM